MAKATKRISRTASARKLGPRFALGRQERARRVRAIRSIIRAFGSPKAIADLCCVEPSAVDNWLTEGHIPPGVHYQLHLGAAHRGEQINPATFGLRPNGTVLQQRRKRACTKLA